MVSKKKCKFEGCNSNFIWSKGYCKNHFLIIFPPKPLKRGAKIAKVSPKQKEKNIAKKEATKELHKKMEEFFYKGHRILGNVVCEQCCKPIYKFSTCNVHHLLPKGNEKYKKVALNEEYWMILCADCHSSWENGGIGETIKDRTLTAKADFLAVEMFKDTDTYIIVEKLKEKYE